MGQPRASRRKIVTISSDEEGEEASSIVSEDDEPPVKPQHRSSGRLKSVESKKKPLSSTPLSSTQGSTQDTEKPAARGSKAKIKGKAKEEPKPKNKTIFSFFNAATQRQRSSQPSASLEKPAEADEDLEAIHDDLSNDGSSRIAFSKASSTAFALRKRKSQHSLSLDNDARLEPHSATQKFRKTSDGSRVPSITVSNEDKRSWTEQFAPIDLTELAVHKRKVGDVRQWLQTAFSGKRQRLLVMKGAAGTGKTTTIELLAKDMGLEVLEWRNPVGSDTMIDTASSASAQFDEFVRRSGNFVGLDLVASDVDTTVYFENKKDNIDQKPDVKQVMLIEEFPNTFTKTSSALQNFRSTVMQYLSSPSLNDRSPIPIVMIISETLLSTSTAAADSFTAHRLLGPQIMTHPFVNVIEFNDVAPTILTKALETVVLKEARKSGRRKTPGPQVFKHLAETGDIRSAVSSLEFLCLRGEDDDTWSSKIAFTKPKKAKAEVAMTKKEQEALKLVSNRESSLGIFHGVGKVVYNKRLDPASPSELAQPPHYLPHYRRPKVSEVDVDALMDDIGTDVSTFVAALHENYGLSCSSSSTEDMLDSINGCIENISDADLLSLDRFSFGNRAFSGSATDTLRQDEMSFQVAVRGLLFSMPYPVHRSSSATMKQSDAHRMFYPASLRLWKRREEIEGVLDLLTAQMQTAASGYVDLPEHSVRDIEGPAGGVESWKRNAAFKSHQTPADNNSEDATTVTSSSSAKMEVLLEWLPYTALIYESRGVLPTILDQIRTVTTPRSVTTVTDEDDLDSEEGAELEVAAEQWTTDRPGKDLDAQKSLKRTITSKAAPNTEGGGLSIPVETSLTGLVLEDDDIVDE